MLDPFVMLLSCPFVMPFCHAGPFCHADPFVMLSLLSCSFVMLSKFKEQAQR